MKKDDNFTPMSSKIYMKDGSIGYIEDVINNNAGDSLRKIKEVLNASMGNYEGQYSGAATITPDEGYIFNGIRVVSEAVLTCNGNISGITAITFPAGSVFEGRFTSIVIASGGIIAYQGVKKDGE